MYYGYIRAERDGNSVQVQMETIRAFAEERGFSLSSWLEIKSARSEKKSEILSAGDELIVSKLYRLGNDGTRVLSLLKTLLDRGVIIHSVEDGLTLGGDDLSRQLSDAFGLALRIFTEVRSWRSKEGLDILKAEGRKQGRPSGSLNKSYKLDEHARELRRLLSVGVPMSKVARKFNVDINTLRRYLKLRMKPKSEKTA